MVGTDYIKGKYPEDWTDFEIEAFAFNDGKKQAIKEILEALIGGDFKTFYDSEEFTNDSELIEKLFNMKEEIKQDFELYA